MGRLLKVLLERSLALCLLLLCAPLLLATAVVVLITAGRPVLYVEHRVGRGGRPFPLFKFRTLTQHDGPSVAPENDRRIFPAARFLRRWRLDEFPSLVNVVRGEMSLVGPRPLSLDHAAALPEAQRSRLTSVRPGITGPAAIAFISDDAVLSDCEDPESVYLRRLLPEKVALELRYLEQWNLLLDLQLLWLTVGQLWSRRAREKSRERVLHTLSSP